MSSTQNSVRLNAGRARSRRGVSAFVAVLLAVEFLDEIVYGVREPAWPLIRDDLRLSYTQIGVLLSAPGVVACFVEPLLGILGDVWRRRALVLGGGIVFAASSVMFGLSTSFAALLAAEILSAPAGGAFVGLSQASLMDAEPERREKNMARWALAGSVGNAAGPVLLMAGALSGLTWRWPFVAAGALTLLVVALAWRQPFSTPRAGARDEGEEGARHSSFRAAFGDGVREALRALRRREVVRWLVLLQLGDFTWDVLRAFLALYFVDVVGATEARAALAVVAWTWVGLVGDFLLLPLLERVSGLSYLRVSASVVLVLFPAFLLAGGFWTKVSLLCLLGLCNAGWYAILKARLYAEMPGRSGTVMTLGNVFGLAHDLVPLGLGLLAESVGLGAAMWVLVLGPLAMLAGLSTARGGRGGAGAAAVS